VWWCRLVLLTVRLLGVVCVTRLEGFLTNKNGERQPVPDRRRDPCHRIYMAVCDSMERTEGLRRAQRAALTVRYTVQPSRYKVSLTPQPMGLLERIKVRRAVDRATVPAWLVAADQTPARDGTRA
jgi:hypothetical protein